MDTSELSSPPTVTSTSPLVTVSIGRTLRCLRVLQIHESRLSRVNESIMKAQRTLQQVTAALNENEFQQRTILNCRAHLIGALQEDRRIFGPDVSAEPAKQQTRAAMKDQIEVGQRYLRTLQQRKRDLDQEVAEYELETGRPLNLVHNILLQRESVVERLSRHVVDLILELKRNQERTW